MRNVLVSGAHTPLSRRLLAHLRDHSAAERVVGVEPAASRDWVPSVELVAFGPDHRQLVEFLRGDCIDTVIHCGLAMDRSGDVAPPGEAKVIDTMRLGAAIGAADVPVRAWVVASSSAVYPANSQAPLLHREDGETDPSELSPAASLLEAEEYARDVAERTPHLNVCILRLQQLAGAGIRGALAALLQQPVLPSVIGYDPALQLLAGDDAVRAIAFAAELELAGTYNVASAGVLRLSEAVRALERPSLPVLPLEAGPFAPIARRIGLPHVPEGMLGVLRFGHAVDTAKLGSAGFRPDYDQAGCLASLCSNALRP